MSGGLFWELLENGLGRGVHWDREELSASDETWNWGKVGIQGWGVAVGQQTLEGRGRKRVSKRVTAKR